jgi:hypothetical protein
MTAEQHSKKIDEVPVVLQMPQVPVSGSRWSKGASRAALSLLFQTTSKWQRRPSPGLFRLLEFDNHGLGVEAAWTLERAQVMTGLVRLNTI